MSTEATLQNQKIEQVSQSDIEAAIENASFTVMEMFEEDEAFQQFLVDRPNSVDLHDELSIWAATEEYALHKEGLEAVSLDSKSFALIALLPNTLMLAEMKQTEKLDYRKIKAIKKQLCAYERRIQDFVDLYPQNYQAFIDNMFMASEVMFASKSTRFSEFCKTAIAEMTRGARHERGFQSLMEAAGFECVQSTVDDDVDRGTDYWVTIHGRVWRVDVKASASEVEASGGNGNVFVKDGADHITCYSMLNEKTVFIDNSFEPDPAYLERIAPTVRHLFEIGV